jgi:hypothetical protein
MRRPPRRDGLSNGVSLQQDQPFLSGAQKTPFLRLPETTSGNALGGHFRAQVDCL